MARKSAPSSRRRTRVAALQTLFEIDSVDHSLEQVLAHVGDSQRLSGPATEFLVTLTTGVLDNYPRIDDLIAEFAPSWPLSQMAIIDRNVLRIAIYEMAVGRQTPPKVAINEAVDLAKAFGSESSPRFVNGVLGSVMEWSMEARVR